MKETFIEFMEFSFTNVFKPTAMSKQTEFTEFDCH